MPYVCRGAAGPGGGKPPDAGAGVTVGVGSGAHPINELAAAPIASRANASRRVIRSSMACLEKVASNNSDLSRPSGHGELEMQPPNVDVFAAILFGYIVGMDPLLSRITIDAAICHGKPCIRGLRYPVETLLELLSSGMSIDDILADYEDLERDDLLAALAFATRLARTRRLQPVGP